jgi:hypothetical protein
VFALTQVADLALAGVGFGMQPPKLRVLLSGLAAHDLTTALGPPHARRRHRLAPRAPLSTPTRRARGPLEVDAAAASAPVGAAVGSRSTVKRGLERPIVPRG